MTAKSPSGLCAVCGGTRVPGNVMWAVDLGHGVVVVRQVPATVCDQCGHEWIDHATALELDRIVEDARNRRAFVEVVAFS